ncbi:hypothetical protein ACLH0K_09005 [Arthrobacter sp. MPF02]|uniref:hypothetical protein n=1 Tax=Arthrobacter sp. MPF02 TaxID=3388492 RepID=UPI00398521C8
MKKPLGVALSVVALLYVLAVVLVFTGVWSPPWEAEAAPAADGSIAVEQGKDVTLPSKDGSPEVTIPGSAISGEGRLHVEPVALPENRSGWAINMDGAQLTGEATLVFKNVVEDGEPAPLVGFNESPSDPIQYVLDAEVSGRDLVVRTNHFSNWLTQKWDWLMDQARGELDRIYRDSGIGEQPQCELEAEARAGGVSVTSDSGGRVQWCLGRKPDGSTVLKVNNSRGYAVSAERTPGLTIGTRSLDFGQMVPRLAKYITAPSKRGNVIDIIGPGETVEYRVDESSGLKGVNLQPSPPAYLATALWFGIQTAAVAFDGTNLLGKVPVEKIETAMDAADCVAGFQDMATADVTHAAAAGNYLNGAIGTVMSCMGKVMERVAMDDAPEEILRNFVAVRLAQVMSWLSSGLQTAASGFAAAAETALNYKGYTIALTYPAASTPAASLIPGLPPALSGKWCTRSAPTSCFSAEETKRTSPEARIEYQGSSDSVPGATDYTLCIRMDLGDGCTTASSIYLRYFPTGVAWNCTEAEVAGGFRMPACDPDYTAAHDVSQPRLVRLLNHQHASTYIDSPPMYRTQ